MDAGWKVGWIGRVGGRLGTWLGRVGDGRSWLAKL